MSRLRLPRLSQDMGYVAECHVLEGGWGGDAVGPGGSVRGGWLAVP